MPKRPPCRRGEVPRDRCEESVGKGLFSRAARRGKGGKRSFAVEGPPADPRRGYEIKRRNLKGYSRLAAPGGNDSSDSRELRTAIISMG
jgi:hypothetical protein